MRAEENSVGVFTMSARTNDTSGDGITTAFCTGTHVRPSNILSIITDDSQTIEIVFSNGGGNEVHVRTQGWYFPIGM